MVLASSAGVYFGLAAAFLSAVLFGLGDFSVTIYTRRMSPFAFVGILYIIEVPALFVLLVSTGEFGSFQTNIALVLLGCLGTVAYSFLVYGLTQGHISVVMSMAGLFALAIPALATIVIGESTSWVIWLGVAICACAVVLITQARSADEGEDVHTHARGLKLSIVLGTISGLCAGAYFTGLGHMDASILQKLFMLQLSGFIAGVIYFAMKRPYVIREKKFIIWLPFIGLAYNVAQAVIPFAMDKTSVIVANVIVNLYPGVTIALAMLFLHEKTSRIQKIGFLAAVFGIIFVSVGMG